MKIKIVNDNKEINLNDILLIGNNPRYTINNKWENEEDFLNFFFSNNSEQEKIIYKLLHLEDDFKNLVSLLESIDEYGYMNFPNDKIILIKKENQIVVAEGNRRVMILKMISDKGLFKIINEIKKENNSKESKDDNKRRERIDYVLKLLNKIQNDKRNLDVDVVVYDSNKKPFREIWNLIYNKHLSGDQKGLRRWPRSKYFADLLLNFKDGFKEDEIERNSFFKILFKDKTTVKEDFKNSQFLYWTMYSEKINDDNFFKNKKTIKDIEIDEEVLKEMRESTKTSALEKNHSWNKIIKIIYNKIFFMSEEKFEKEHVELKYDKDDLMYFDFKLTNPTIILKFIKNKWKEGILTTRDFNEKDEYSLSLDLSLVLEYKEDIFKKESSDEILKTINPYKLSLDSLKKIIDINTNSKSSRIKYFKDVVELRNKEKKLFDELEKIFSENNNLRSEKEPIGIFFHLWKQINFVKEEDYIILKSISIRATLEQLFFWMIFSCIKDEESKTNYIQSLYNEKKSIMIDLWNKFTQDNNKNNRNNRNNKNENRLFYFLNTEQIKEIMYENFQNEKINEENEIIKFIKEIGYFNSERLLLSTIHSFHQTYFYEEYDKLNNEFIESMEIIKKIFKNISFEKLHKMNEKIKEEMKKESSHEKKGE